jgi:hypothetical protein
LRAADSTIIVVFTGTVARRAGWIFPGGHTNIRNIQPTDPLAVQLVEVAGLRDACDLDLLLFFSRHPRVVLSSEQLAAYVGYDLPQVARALDLLLGAGLLKRALNHGTPGRMYVLEVDHAEEWLEPLRRVCATPDGRNAVKTLLRQRQPQYGARTANASPTSIRRRDHA